MLELLNEIEKEVALMLVKGQNCRAICEWLDIEYSEYVKIKKSILQKLKIRRICQIIYKVTSRGLQEI